MPYTVVPQLPSTDDYVRLLDSVGLGGGSRHAAQIGLSNSLYSVVALHRRTTVGMGRVIGDGGCYFTLVDIAVSPQHQNRGVGNLIMKALLEFIDEKAPVKARVSLTAQHGTVEFFAKYGFKTVRPMERTGLHFTVRSRR